MAWSFWWYAHLGHSHLGKVWSFWSSTSILTKQRPGKQTWSSYQDYHAEDVLLKAQSSWRRDSFEGAIIKWNDTRPSINDAAVLKSWSWSFVISYFWHLDTSSFENYINILIRMKVKYLNSLLHAIDRSKYYRDTNHYRGWIFLTNVNSRSLYENTTEIQILLSRSYLQWKNINYSCNFFIEGLRLNIMHFLFYIE